MVPKDWQAEIGRHVVIAWNGRPEGARAVAAAMPMLEAARKVTLLRIGGIDPDRPGLDELSEYLGDHRIAADVEVRDNGGRGVGEAILRASEDLGADMLVIGAYSHSRWREMVLGGVTEHIVGNATVPVFMSH